MPVVDIDEISYLDQLHAMALSAEAAEDRARAKRRFFDNVFLLWPEITVAFNDPHLGE